MKDSPEIPSSVSKFMEMLTTKRDAKANTASQRPDDATLKREFDEIYEMAMKALKPVADQLARDVADHGTPSVASDGTPAFGSHRLQALLAAYSQILCHAGQAFVLSVDGDMAEKTGAAVQITKSVTKAIESAMRMALLISVFGGTPDGHAPGGNCDDKDGDDD